MVNEKEVRLVAFAMIGMALLLQTISLLAGTGNIPVIRHELGHDFMSFYTAGKTVNHLPILQLYDPDVQQRLRAETLPGADDSRRLPYLYPPFVAGAMSVLARLPYRWAFAAWLAIGGALYALGLWLLQKRCELPPGTRKTAVLLAVAFSPFLFEAWGGGQISALAFVSLAATLWLEKQGRPFLAGVCAGICCYKPTLLVVLAALFLVAGLWRLLAGVVASSGALAGLSCLMLGREGVLKYIALMKQYSTGVAQRPEAWPLHKFVDLNAFFHLLLGGDTPVGRVLFVLTAGGVLLALAARWVRYSSLSPDERALCWAGTFPAILLASFYAPVYDMTLLVLSGFLAAGVVYREGREQQRKPFETMVLVVLCLPLFGQTLAQAAHLQLLTPMLALCSAFAFLRRTESSRRVQTNSQHFEPRHIFISGWL